MYQFFYSIHQFISRFRWLSAGLAVLVLLIFGFFASRLKFEEDITKLIPSGGNKDVTTQVLRQMNFADKITVIFEARQNADPEELQSAADAFLQKAQSVSPFLSSVQGRVDDENLQQTIDFVYENLPIFLDKEDYETIGKRLQPDSVSQVVEQNYRSMMSPSGLVTTSFIRRDPLGLTFIGLKKLQQLQLGSDFTLENGYVMTKDRKMLLVFLTPRTSSSETEQNKKLSSGLYEIKAEIDATFGEKVGLSYFGPSLIAVANADIIKTDVMLTTILAMSALMLILMFFYRKAWIPLIIFLPTVFGALFALAVLYFAKETISAISLGIGAILIGITIDYSLHILTHHKHQSDVKTLYKDVTQPLFMSASTTAIAFLCLLFVQSEALRDLGIFAASIVMGSAFFSLIIVPQLYRPERDNFGHNPGWIDRMAGFSFDRNKWLTAGSIVLIIVCCFTAGRVKFDNDLSKLNYIPNDIRKAEQQLEKSSSLTSKTIYLAAHGKTETEAITQNRMLFRELSRLKGEGKILAFSSIGGVVTDESEQRKKINDWEAFWNDQKISEVSDLLVRSGNSVGFKATTYQPFFDRIQTGGSVVPLSGFEEIQALQIPEFLSIRPGFTTVSSLVKVTDAQRSDFIKVIERQPSVVAIDRQQMNETFLLRLRDDFNSLINYSLIAVVLILFVFFRRAGLVLLAMIPIVLTGLLTAGLMGVFGMGLNIFSTIVCTLVFGHGVDFSIFMTSALQKQYTDGKDEMKVYRTSIILAALTTVLGVGALIFARHPSLYSISSVSLIGVFAAILMSFVLYPVLFRWAFFFRPSKGKSPLRIRRTLHSLASFAYYGLGGFLISVTSTLLMKLLPVSREKKLRVFHRMMSGFMTSVLWSYPSVKRRIRNASGETFSKPAVIIANHSCFLDVLAMGSLNPRIVFLVSDWVYQSPVIGRGVKLAGFYPVSEGIEGGLEHLREKVSQGFSLMIFPEGTRSADNSIKRFHKGAFFLAEQFELDIVPVILHGYSEVSPKGDYILNGNTTTVNVLPRITPNDASFGNDYATRTKKINAYMRQQQHSLRSELEGPEYFRKTILGSFDYKEAEVVSAVRRDLDQNLEVYHQFRELIGEKSKVLHLADDYGQLDVLLALQFATRQIDSFIEDLEKRAVARQNYYLKKREIRYLDDLSVCRTTYDCILITAPMTQIQVYPSDLILVLENTDLIANLLTEGFEILESMEKLTVLKRGSAV